MFPREESADFLDTCWMYYAGIIGTNLDFPCREVNLPSSFLKELQPIMKELNFHH